MYTATEFTPWVALAGGILIGVSAMFMLIFNGRVAGISGIIGNLVSSEGHDFDWRPGDSLLLTSDGLTDVLADVVLTNTLVAHQGALVAQAEALIQAAQAAGGQDDKTLVVVES